MKTVRVTDLDSLVPCMTEDEQRDIAEAVAAGVWTVDIAEERYDELWCQSLFRNADIIAKTEDAMRRGVKIPPSPSGQKTNQ